MAPAARHLHAIHGDPDGPRHRPRDPPRLRLLASAVEALQRKLRPNAVAQPQTLVQRPRRLPHGATAVVIGIAEAESPRRPAPRPAEADQRDRKSVVEGTSVA